MIRNKKIIGLLLLASFMFTPAVYAMHGAPKKVWVINKEAVQFYKGKIARHLLRNKYERAGVFCLTAAVVAAGGMYALQEKVQVLDGSSQQKIHDMHATVSGLSVAVKDISARLKPDLNSQDFIVPESQQEESYFSYMFGGLFAYGKHMGKMALDNVVLFVLMGGLPEPIKKLFNFWSSKIEGVVQHVYHDGDFHWFVTTQTQAVPYFNDLERAAELLPLASDQEEREHQVKSVVWSADMLVKQLARVVAFMEYQAHKIKPLSTGCSIQMSASAEYMYRHIALFAQDLQTMLEDPAKHAEIPAFIKTFRERLRSEQDSFCVNERAAFDDVSDLAV